jgi:hypothetical protein
MTFDPNLGPSHRLAGIWEGEKGTDLAPSDAAATNRQVATSRFRERFVFEPTGLVDNHEQVRCTACAIGGRLGASARPTPFMTRSVLDVGLRVRAADPHVHATTRHDRAGRRPTSAPTRASFRSKAKAGDEVFGVCSSPFLSAEYHEPCATRVAVKLLDDDSFYYDEHTWMKMKDREQLFDHRDENTLRRVG